MSLNSINIMKMRYLEMMHLILLTQILFMIHTTNVNISSYSKMQENEDEVNKLLKNEVNKYKSIWKSLSKHNCAIIQNNFDYPIDRSLGNLDSYDIHGRTSLN